MENENNKLENNKEKEPQNKKSKKERKKAKKVAKKSRKAAKKCKKTVAEVEQEKEYYFGHNEDENIWTSFLTEKMFAHRGLWDKNYPENSLAAFNNAIENGYGIELDVNAIEDGTPVIFHDSKMSRMTGKDKYIQNLSKEELENITLLDSEEKIPTLEEVLKLVKGKVPLLIEIKNQEKVGPLERQVLDLLKNYKGEYAIQSFNPYTLRWFYEHAPKIWRGQLASYFKGQKLSIFKKMILRKLGMKRTVSRVKPGSTLQVKHVYQRIRMQRLRGSLTGTGTPSARRPLTRTGRRSAGMQDMMNFCRCSTRRIRSYKFSTGRTRGCAKT